MFRSKDLIWPLTISSQSEAEDLAEALRNTCHDKNSPQGLYVKVPVFCKAMCYARGSFDDRRVRSTYEVLMLTFPNSNCFPCMHWQDAINEIDRAIKSGNPYARETKIMLMRAADEYWAAFNDEQIQQG